MYRNTVVVPTPNPIARSRAAPAPGFLTRAAGYFATHGIARIERP